jgi:hypothetical protein
LLAHPLLACLAVGEVLFCGQIRIAKIQRED